MWVLAFMIAAWAFIEATWPYLLGICAAICLFVWVARKLMK